MTTLSYLDTSYEYNPYTKQIEPRGVTKTNIVSEINLSEEWITISWDKVEINWTTTFSPGYDPSDPVEVSDLWTTVIDWGNIKTSILDVDDIFAQNITATWTITWATLRTSSWNNRAEMQTSWFTIYSSTNTKKIEMSPINSWQLNFYDDTAWALPTTRIESLYDYSTYDTNLHGLDLSYADTLVSDLMINPLKRISFLQSWGWHTNLMSSDTDLTFENAAGATVSVLNQPPVTLEFSKTASAWTGIESYSGFWFQPSSYRILAYRSATGWTCTSDTYTDSLGLSRGVSVKPYSASWESESWTTSFAIRIFYTNGGWSETRASHTSFDTDWITLTYALDWEATKLLITAYP